ncbi:MAG TPA: glycosyltransferase family 39 protein, partial [Bryobacteraceae bacterium]|nr:glycosyltransferase family 39 protein [Bryobacteraceae bacterium]
MILLVSVLFGALFTIAVAFAGGTLLLRGLGLTFYRDEERFFAFVTGAACLSLTVFALSALHLARPWVFLILGIAIIVVASRRGARHAIGERPRGLGRWPRIGFWLLYTAFAVFYLATALAPESSPDGSGYHLGAVSRYLAHGGFFFTTNMYASLSNGLEMLFLYAFAFGRHSAAALVHFSFYLALPLGMLAFGKRFRFPGAAATGGLLVFLSPIVGYDGAAAYNDVALACVLFAVFYLLQIWDRERTHALLIPIGLLAGFAYAIKYTGVLAVPYAAVFVGWKLVRKRTNPLRSLALLSGCALLMIAPWMVKNSLMTGNPLAPFFNSWFPNPYFHIGSEIQYRHWMATWGDLASKWEIPLEVTVGGSRLQGLLGLAFLLAPIALIALRRPMGRHLLLAAAVFGATYPANIGTRFLIPMLPFLAISMGLALADWKWAAPLLLAFHACTAWPVNLKQYCHPDAMRVEKFPHKAALRIETESSYLSRKLPGYQVARLLDETVPPQARILCFSPAPEAYTSRDQLVSYQGALEENLTDMLRAVVMPYWHPTKRYSFRFAQQSLRRIRVVQEGTASNPDEFWTVNEFRVRYKH